MAKQVIKKPRTLYQLPNGTFTEQEVQVTEDFRDGSDEPGTMGVIQIGDRQRERGLGIKKWKINIKYTRLTNNIPEVLWVPTWGSINKDTDYYPVLQTLGLLSEGMAIDLAVLQNGDYEFSYTKDGNTDKVIVHSLTRTNYSQLVNMIFSGSWFTADFIRYVVENGNFSEQFAAGDIEVAVNSDSGIAAQDSIEVGANKGPDQFQNPILDVYADYKVDSVWTYVVPMVNSNEVRDITHYYFGVKWKSVAKFPINCKA